MKFDRGLPRPLRSIAILAIASFPLTSCMEFWSRHREVTVATDDPRPEVSDPGPPEPEPPVDPPRPEPPPPNGSIPTARAVPGRPGFVFSPYNNKLVDVKGHASGRMVADPYYPTSERKYFRVP